MGTVAKHDLLDAIRQQLLVDYFSMLFEVLTQEVDRTVDSIRRGVDQEMIASVEVVLFDRSKKLVGKAHIAIDWDSYSVQGLYSRMHPSAESILYKIESLKQKLDDVGVVQTQWKVNYNSGVEPQVANTALGLRNASGDSFYHTYEQGMFELEEFLRELNIEFEALMKKNVHAKKTELSKSQNAPKRKAGFARGVITNVSEDFDAPLDVFKDYTP